LSLALAPASRSCAAVVPPSCRGAAAWYRRPRFVCRQGAAELRDVAQVKPPRSRARVRVFVVMSLAKRLIGESCHRKIDRESEIVSPLTLTLSHRGRGDKRKQALASEKMPPLQTERPKSRPAQAGKPGLPAGGQKFWLWRGEFWLTIEAGLGNCQKRKHP
jgi:hypothetical protein